MDDCIPVQLLLAVGPFDACNGRRKATDGEDLGEKRDVFTSPKSDTFAILRSPEHQRYRTTVSPFYL